MKPNAVRWVDCPTCGAPPGKGCRTSGTQQNTVTHASRAKVAFASTIDPYLASVQYGQFQYQRAEKLAAHLEVVRAQRDALGRIFGTRGIEPAVPCGDSRCYCGGCAL